EHFDYSDYSVNKAGVYPERNGAIKSIYYAFDDEGKIAAVIYETKTPGYENGEVTTLVGIKIDGTFEKVAVIEAKNQTPGIGDQILDFDFGVVDDDVNQYSYNTISQATFSSAAVHRGIDVAAAHFKATDFGGITNE
ncbi:MAG: FMN-binding protein, partial [Bacilli bacterium]|nr:FMN-binding protein [Bacilli bacterium]